MRDYIASVSFDTVCNHFVDMGGRDISGRHLVDLLRGLTPHTRSIFA